MNEVIPKVISEYLNSYSGIYHTKRAKRIDLEHFLFFIKTYNIKTFTDISKNSVQLFIDLLIKNGMSPSTVSRCLATIKHFFKWLKKTGKIIIDPCEEVRFGYISKGKPDHLTAKEVKELVDKIQQNLSKARNFREYQDYFLVLFLLETGIRADEARMLKLTQISPDYQWIKNIRSKGNKFRDVYIPNRLRTYLTDFIERRNNFIKSKIKKLHNLNSYSLFVSSYGKEYGSDSLTLSPKTIWRIVRRVGVGLNLHPHKLRHTFAIRLLEHTKDIRLVSQALGHSDIRITMKYTERTNEEIKKAIDSLNLI